MIASLEMLPTRPVLFRRPAALRNVSSVRRALYRSEDDVQESLEHVRNEMLALARRDRERWNFDFQTERPLAGGRYVWEPVNPQARSTQSRREELRPADQAQNPNTLDLSPKAPENLTQTKLPDFWSKRKRHSSSPVRKTVSSEDQGPSPAKVQRTASS